MVNHYVYEPDSVSDKVEEADVSIGDTLEFISNNQEGYAKYLVVAGENGAKSLRQIEDFDGVIENNDNEIDVNAEENDEGYNSQMGGSKKSKFVLKSNKNKSRRIIKRNSNKKSSRSSKHTRRHRNRKSGRSRVRK
jgi:hypothetical protein